MFSQSKGNAFVFFLLTIGFLVLSGVIMWFLSGIVPSAMNINTETPLVVVPRHASSQVGTTTPSGIVQSESLNIEQVTTVPPKENISQMLAPAINPLEGAYTNPFE